jgi:FtsH-binding integral membrane protein
MSTLIFQCLIGYLSILNVFDKNKDLSKLEKVFSTFAAIFSVGVMIVILLKVPISEVYQSFYLGLFVLTILFFASIFLKKTTVE